eukprot:s2737_g14.t1
MDLLMKAHLLLGNEASAQMFIWCHKSRTPHALLVSEETGRDQMLTKADNQHTTIKSKWHGKCEFDGEKMVIHLHWLGEESKLRLIQLQWDDSLNAYATTHIIVKPVEHLTANPMASLCSCSACLPLHWLNGCRQHVLLLDLQNQKVNMFSYANNEHTDVISSGWHGHAQFTLQHQQLHLALHWKGDASKLRQVTLLWDKVA